MGMEKLGTKGPAFIAPITMRTKFSLSFSFRNLDPYKFWILKITRKLKKKNFFDEVESPPGAPKALISPKSTESPLVPVISARKQQAIKSKRWPKTL
jgi:hypothetical protein